MSIILVLLGLAAFAAADCPCNTYKPLYTNEVNIETYDDWKPKVLHIMGDVYQNMTQVLNVVGVS